MENDHFVNKLIAGTKSNAIQWEVADRYFKLRNKIQTDCDIYITKRKSKEVAILKKPNPDSENSEKVDYEIIIWEYKDALFEITENDLEAKEVLLVRLFKLAERNAKRIDQLLNDLVNDIDD